MKFSIGYNQTNDFSDLLMKYKDNIESVYFALPLSLGNSGRDLEQDNYYEKKIFNLIKICKESGIENILVINATCEGEKTGDKYHLLELISYIKKLRKIGLNSISLTNLLYVKFIKKSIPELKIYSSVNCYVKTVEQALYMKKIGIDVLTIDRDINRDLDLIKEIKVRTGLPIQILLNEGCFRNCPFRNTHFNIISHGVENNVRNNSKGNYNLLEKYSCLPLLAENKRMVFRVPFVRPEDLHYYEGLTDVFKLTTRDNPIKEVELMLLAYVQGYYHGNLFDIIPSCVWHHENIVNYIDNDKLTKFNFFEDIKKCIWDCDNCFNCDKYF
ncbi:MAG: U32 family peptidase [Candidatus Gracilibacteria bacterium]|nr:U32 family peptidase [Candidatus Gracilibacteria bacterium]MDD2908606.1 U32 family peptidase [Candidatus Gracilibacteria bacterium]